jgi:hypothetical protein
MAYAPGRKIVGGQEVELYSVVYTALGEECVGLILHR